MPATEIKPDTAWTEDAPTGLRSRYSGVPLKDGEMIVTILSQGSLSFGHQVIAFEWRDDGLKNSGISYRKHKAFHLYPRQDFRGADPGTLAARATSQVPGTIERTRATRMEGNEPKSASKYKAGSDEDAKSKLLTYNAKYRSWKVDFKSGWDAFSEAKRDWKNPPQFNLVNVGNGVYNCAGWVQKIAKIAGIDTGTMSGQLGFPVPVWEVERGREVLDEDEMWKKRA